jgi:23S rRNA (adenine-N6)-dimethyltransferase
VATATRWWGWHQLDPRWAARLVADARVGAGSCVLDIGAGRGALTAPLVAAGARVIAVEAHPERAAHLRQTFGQAVTVVQADAADLRLPRRPYQVVSNPPFAVTTAVLRRLLQPGSRMTSAHLIVDAHAARRWTSPGAPGAGRWGRTFSSSLGPIVPRAAFDPSPARDARVLIIQRRV